MDLDGAGRDEERVVGVPAGVQDLHGDLGSFVLVHRIGHVPMHADLHVCVCV